MILCINFSILDVFELKIYNNHFKVNLYYGTKKFFEVSVIVLCYKASNLIKTFLDDIIFEADKIFS